MKISKLIINKIKNNPDFRKGTADAINIYPESLIRTVNRNPASGKLYEYPAIEFYKSQGFSLEQIFEPAKLETV